MKRFTLRQLIFMAVCCDLGLVAKKLIAPAANLITDSLHIPGGIGTSFSLMFLVVAAMVCRKPGCAAIMSVIQSLLALAFGMVGSMGALAPVGYIVPGLVIDCVLALAASLKLSVTERAALANALAGMSAAAAANAIVFHLTGPPLWLYLCVGFSSGIFCGILGSAVVKRIAPVWEAEYGEYLSTTRGKK